MPLEGVSTDFHQIFKNVKDDPSTKWPKCDFEPRRLDSDEDVDSAPIRRQCLPRLHRLSYSQLGKLYNQKNHDLNFKITANSPPPSK